MHSNHVSRLFSRHGETFASHLLRVRLERARKRLERARKRLERARKRLERARKLLSDPALNVSEVALLSGFVNANYFIRTFKARSGQTPGRARVAD